MLAIFKKVLFSITLNSALFFLLIVGIQNSSNKNKVRFINGETVNLPVSFIVGISFITGSVYGGFFINNLSNKQ